MDLMLIYGKLLYYKFNNDSILYLIVCLFEFITFSSEIPSQFCDIIDFLSTDSLRLKLFRFLVVAMVAKLC